MSIYKDGKKIWITKHPYRPTGLIPILFESINSDRTNYGCLYLSSETELDYLSNIIKRDEKIIDLSSINIYFPIYDYGDYVMTHNNGPFSLEDILILVNYTWRYVKGNNAEYGFHILSSGNTSYISYKGSNVYLSISGFSDDNV